MEWLKSIAPTVATALLGPLGGVAVSALGELLGVSGATQEKITSAIKAGNLTPDQITKLKELEIEYQNNEKERGFKYSELAFKDRDSARKANVSGGTQKMLFWLSLVLLVCTLGTEITVIFYGYPEKTPEIVVGRVLGLMDAVAMMVMSYWYGTTSSSADKNKMLLEAK